jgi:hypothetical protein
MKQPNRWTKVSMHMLKRHKCEIFGRRSGLSWPQRYQFISGWLPWISDGLGMVMTIVAIGWTLLMWLLPSYVDVPTPALSAAAMALFATKLFKTLVLYPPKVRSGLRGAVYASVAGLALTHTVGKAMWSGLLTSGAPFLRTPKCEDSARFSQVLRVIWQETLLLSLLLIAMVSMLFDRGLMDPAVTLWMVMLGVQALPYAATFITASVSAKSNAATAAPVAPADRPAMPEAA